jgi:hypothetical protein
MPPHCHCRAADHVVFARQREERRSQSSENRSCHVELFGLGKMRDVAGVNHERRLLG